MGFIPLELAGSKPVFSFRQAALSLDVARFTKLVDPAVLSAI
jgi:hypothetical protein